MNKTTLIAICLVFISALSAAEDHESQNRSDGKRKAIETKSFQGEIVGMKAIGGETTGYGIVVGEKKNKKGNLEKIVKEIEPGEFREQLDKLIETGRKVELTTYPTIYKGSERVAYKVFKVVGLKIISESAEKFKCPEETYINCQPVVPERYLKYCSGEYHKWIKDNCPLVKFVY